jgi:hypothetical protein
MNKEREDEPADIGTVKQIPRTSLQTVSQEFLLKPKFSQGYHYDYYHTPAVVNTLKYYEIDESARVLHLGGDGFFVFSRDTFHRIEHYNRRAQEELNDNNLVGCFHNLLVFSGGLMVAPRLKGYCGLVNSYSVLAGRQLLPKPQEVDFDFKPYFEYFFNEFLERGNIQPYEFNVWNSAFPGARRKQHVKSKDKLCPRKVLISNFVKNESTPVSKWKAGKEFRCVSSYDHCFNIVNGPYWKSVASYISKVLTIECQYTYGCKLTGEEAGRWYDLCKEQGYNYFYKGDYKRWDGRFIRAILIAAMNQFHTFFGFPAHVREIDLKQVDKVGLFKYLCDEVGTWYYTAFGTTPSGAQWTSIINSIAGLVIIYTYCKLFDKDWKTKQNGDDLIFGSKVKEDLSLLPDWIREVSGMELEAEVCTETNLTFCSKLFWPLNGYTVLSALPGRQLSKLGWNTKTFENMKDYANGLYQSIYQSYNFIPVLRSYLRLLEKIYDLEPNELNLLGKDVYKFRCRTNHEMDESITGFFYDRYCRDYGYCWSDVTTAEKLIEEVESFPCLLKNSFIDHMITLDGNT